MRYKLVMMLWMQACMLCAGGCQRDETMPESSGSMVNLGLNLGTYALEDDDTNALPHEKQIRSLYVFIYNADGKLENSGKTKVTAASGGSLVDATGRINGSWKVYEGIKTVYVMANVPEKLKTIFGGTAAADVLNAPTLSSLQDLCSDNNSYYSDYCLNQGENWTGGLMSGGTTAAVTTAKSEVAVPLTRRYARIDLAVKKSPELASATVKVTGIQWQNFCPDARLLALSSEWRGQNISYKVSGLQNSFTLTSDYIRVRPKTTGTAGVEYEIYVMPKPLNGEFSIPVALQLDVDINGKTESYTIYLAETAADGTQDPAKPLAIQANKIYKVNATLLRRSTDVDITIKDWEDRAIQGDIAGTYLGFSRTKVIMDWWMLGRTFKANVDYVSDGTVSFVGYVLKNANGTDKSVTTDGTNMPSWLNAGRISGIPDGTAKKGTITAEYRVMLGPNPDVYLRFKTGTVIKDIQFVCDNGFIPKADLKSQGWPEALLPGVGIQVAKRGNVNPNYDALAADPKVQWATSTIMIPSASGAGYGAGLSNTDAVIAALGPSPLNSAAAKCRALGPGWYLMSRDEEVVLYKTKDLMSALSYSFIYKDGGGYWTSSEAQRDAGQYSYFIYFNDSGRANTNEKTNPNMNLRCVCNIDPIMLSTTQLAADYANWGNRFSTDVTFESSEGAVSIQSIDNVGPSKNWLTTAEVSGTTKGKITVTYAPTLTWNGTHDDVAIILGTASGATKTLTVKYDNGLIPASALPAGWVLRPSVGLQSAKIGNNLPTGVADANWDKELMQWATTNTSVPAAQASGYGYGTYNTTAMISVLGAGATAANKCRSLGEDWYFSSKDELTTIYSSKNYLGPSYLFGALLYRSATENYSDFSWYLNFTTGTSGNSLKTNDNGVRCVRNIDQIMLSTTQLAADYANWGNRFSADVTFESEGAAVFIQSIDNVGPSKNWLITAQVSGTTKGKITVTYVPTEYATHDDVAIILGTVSGATKTLTVKYDNGLIPVRALSAAWTLNRPSMGLQMAKIGNVLPSGVADANWDKESMPWATTTTSVPAAQAVEYGYGTSNTTAMISVLGTGATSANKCRSLGEDWYFSSRDELMAIYSSKNYLGPSYSFNASDYWSATDFTSTNSWFVYFTSGSTNNDTKTSYNYVRCVRNL